MPEKFIPEDAMPREHRDMAKKLAESHGQEGGHTIPSVKKRKMFGLRKTTFAEKQNWAGQNLWTDAILGKLKSRRFKASPTDQKEKSAIEKVANATEWADEKIEDEGEEEKMGEDREEEVEPGEDKTPGGFLETDTEKQQGDKITEVFKLAGFEEINKLTKRLWAKRNKLGLDLKDWEPYKKESKEDINKEITKVKEEEEIIGRVVDLVAGRLGESEFDLAKKIKRYINIIIEIMFERMSVSAESKNRHQLDVLDDEINDMRELIAALIRDHSRKKND